MANEKTQNQAVSDNSLDAHIRAEQIRIIYNNMPSVLLSNSLVPLLLLYALWDEVSRTMMLLWAALMLGLGIMRFSLLIRFRHAAPSPALIDRWGVYLILSTFVSGCLWGAAGVVLTVPDLPVQFSLIILILAGTGAASVISFGAHLPVFYAYFLPSLLPFVGAALLRQEQVQLVMAIAAILYVFALSFLAHNMHKVFTDSLRLRFENFDLVKELTAQKESAERANAAKTRFLAAASHDLRQPLHAMGLFVSALSERVRGAVTRKLVLQLGASTDALRGLLNALLDISRLDAGVIQPRITPCSVQDLFDRLAHDYSAHALEKNISFRFVPTIYWVQCDATLLERIVRNLVSNAIRYTNNGGVRVGCRRCGEQLRIEVWDSGIGIAAHELDNIFYEFYQVGNPERDREKGLGLGLAIAQRLAHLLNHRIDVKSAPGKGSVFALTLPRSNAIHAEGEAPKSVAVGHLRAALVLVIDDELAIREATQIMLQDWGCETVLADSAESALDVIAQTGRSPEVIIADYRLRNSKTGVEAIETLHAKYGRDIPAIIITGDTAPDRLREAEASGYHLLHKPLAPARLRALLSYVLSQRH